MPSFRHAPLSRRALLKGSLGAAAALALPERLAWAAPPASRLPLITREIPSTGERLPVVGLGTNAYSVTDPEELAARREVLEQMPRLGGSVVDTARVYGESEVVIGRLMKQLGNRDRLFLATKAPIRGEMLPGDGELLRSLERLQVERIDLMQIHNFHEIGTLFPRMREWKQAGKVRYLGVSTSVDEQYPQLISALRKLPLDFIQVDYSLDNRSAADEVLPLAREQGVAVLINMPLGGRSGNVLSRLRQHSLPDWAAEFDATSWAQVLLKYNISHPAVTAVIPGTTKLRHLHDNQQAARGRLPDAQMRERIERFWDSLA